MIVRRMMIALAATATLSGVAPAAGQWAVPPAVMQTAVADSGGGGGASLFDRQDVYWAAGFATLAAVAVPLDRSLAGVSQRPALQANRILSSGSTGARLLGNPGAAVIGGVIYGAGRVTGQRDVARLGLHTAEAVIIGDLITGGIKMVAGRKRPYASPDNPDDFKFMRGFAGDSTRSFPSGHTTSAFAAAAAATAEVGYQWPAGKAVVGPILFGAAGLVGISRMYNNAHWASDVVVGAAIGTFVGWKVTRFSHDHPNNEVDNLFLGRERGGSGDSQPQANRGRANRSRTLLGSGIPITFSIPAP